MGQDSIWKIQKSSWWGSLLIVFGLLVLFFLKSPDAGNERVPEMHCNGSERFVRVPLSDIAGTSKIRNRTFFIVDDAGAFLARLWTLYGPPDAVMYEGFVYAFRDTQTDLIFTAYLGGSGTAYGGFSSQASELKPVLKMFDTLLQDVPLADCEIEFETDYGRIHIGAKNGVPFMR